MVSKRKRVTKLKQPAGPSTSSKAANSVNITIEEDKRIKNPRGDTIGSNVDGSSLPGSPPTSKRRGIISPSLQTPIKGSAPSALAAPQLVYDVVRLASPTRSSARSSGISYRAASDSTGSTPKRVTAKIGSPSSSLSNKKRKLESEIPVDKDFEKTHVVLPETKPPSVNEKDLTTLKNINSSVDSYSLPPSGMKKSNRSTCFPLKLILPTNPSLTLTLPNLSDICPTLESYLQQCREQEEKVEILEREAVVAGNRMGKLDVNGPLKASDFDIMSSDCSKIWPLLAKELSDSLTFVLEKEIRPSLLRLKELLVFTVNESINIIPPTSPTSKDQASLKADASEKIKSIVQSDPRKILHDMHSIEQRMKGRRTSVALLPSIFSKSSSENIFGSSSTDLNENRRKTELEGTATKLIDRKLSGFSQFKPVEANSFLYSGTTGGTTSVSSHLSSDTYNSTAPAATTVLKIKRTENGAFQLLTSSGSNYPSRTNLNSSGSYLNTLQIPVASIRKLDWKQQEVEDMTDQKQIHRFTSSPDTLQTNNISTYPSPDSIPFQRSHGGGRQSSLQSSRPISTASSVTLPSSSTVPLPLSPPPKGMGSSQPGSTSFPGKKKPTGSGMDAVGATNVRPSSTKSISVSSSSTKPNPITTSTSAPIAQVSNNIFWSTVENFFRPITEEDLKWLDRESYMTATNSTSSPPLSPKHATVFHNKINSKIFGPGADYHSYKSIKQDSNLHWMNDNEVDEAIADWMVIPGLGVSIPVPPTPPPSSSGIGSNNIGNGSFLNDPLDQAMNLENNPSLIVEGFGEKSRKSYGKPALSQVEETRKLSESVLRTPLPFSSGLATRLIAALVEENIPGLYTQESSNYSVSLSSNSHVQNTTSGNIDHKISHQGQSFLSKSGSTTQSQQNLNTSWNQHSSAIDNISNNIECRLRRDIFAALNVPEDPSKANSFSYSTSDPCLLSPGIHSGYSTAGPFLPSTSSIPPMKNSSIPIDPDSHHRTDHSSSGYSLDSSIHSYTFPWEDDPICTMLRQLQAKLFLQHKQNNNRKRRLFQYLLFGKLLLDPSSISPGASLPSLSVGILSAVEYFSVLEELYRQIYNLWNRKKSPLNISSGIGASSGPYFSATSNAATMITGNVPHSQKHQSISHLGAIGSSNLDGKKKKSKVKKVLKVARPVSNGGTISPLSGSITSMSVPKAVPAIGNIGPFSSLGSSSSVMASTTTIVPGKSNTSSEHQTSGSGLPLSPNEIWPPLLKEALLKKNLLLQDIGQNVLHVVSRCDLLPFDPTRSSSFYSREPDPSNPSSLASHRLFDPILESFEKKQLKKRLPFPLLYDEEEDDKQDLNLLHKEVAEYNISHEDSIDIPFKEKPRKKNLSARPSSSGHSLIPDPSTKDLDRFLCGLVPLSDMLDPLPAKERRSSPEHLVPSSQSRTGIPSPTSISVMGLPLSHPNPISKKKIKLVSSSSKKKIPAESSPSTPSSFTSALS